ncbi:MAG: acetyl-CoA carboxylase biotin carboxylase subunit [Bacteroidetes bacterium]|nr:acetyl-CoA carboxylase biotin carboxylase subunit [Bacteroidota bacterium]
MRKIKKILIANRGEIALRVMHSAKEMGITTVAIFSEADKNSPYVRYADEAICVGPPPSTESYLNGDNIIEACKQAGADAIHPGYGFLSENSGFARKVAEANLIFIGPSPESMELMGSKLAAKEAVSKYNIPMIPGSKNLISNVKEAKVVAKDIGYPVLIKAIAGGGGKGMRVVWKEAHLEEEMKRATSEAVSAFGDGAVFLEKFIEYNKHIEFQILGDQQGNVIHLFERECSIQRRHQKIIEEAPSTVLTAELREEMGQAAINVAKSCGYYSAGTVEFIFDQNNNYYFLEMNTRLQVEHPVTEAITGLDLVKEQIKIAEGRKLDIRPEDLHITGHAIEVRVYAEDPSNDFLPDVGKLKRYRPPQGPGVRVDDGFEEGMEIPIYYDPMISKLIVSAKNREEAINRMTKAIEDYEISGIETTLDFCKFVINHKVFIDGTFNTRFVEKYFSPEKLDFSSEAGTDELKVAAVIASKLSEQHHLRHIPDWDGRSFNKWRFRSNYQ